MSWRLQIVHTTTFRYAAEVRSSYNEARITPLTTPSQLVLESAVDVEPAGQVSRYLDYWGSVVHSFDVAIPHTELTVTGRSVVQTSPWPASMSPAKATWCDLAPDRLDGSFAELLAPTPIVAADVGLRRVAAAIRAQHPPAQAGAAVVEWVRSQLAYVPGTTVVSTSALEAWRGGRGVCQDFAHLTLAVARAMGIPGRYCSGYLHTDPEAAVGSAVEGESHAWVELWVGDWVGYDPTTDSPPGERHVLLARGRDYHDVAPLKGIFNGGPTSGLDVSVRLTRLA